MTSSSLLPQSLCALPSGAPAERSALPSCRQFAFRRVNGIAIASLLLLHALLLLRSAVSNSATLNEPAHLASGLVNWTQGRFESYRVNPPLVRMIAAVPVLGMGFQADWSDFYDGPGARSEFPLGNALIRANSESFQQMLIAARCACIPLSCLGAWICYRWSLELWKSHLAGWLSLLLWTFDPSLLAAGSLICPDSAAAALGLAAAYTFWRWLKVPTWKSATLAGGVLGIALLAKTLWCLLIPVWGFIFVVDRLQQFMSRRAEKNRSSAPMSGQKVSPESNGGLAKQLILQVSLALYLVNAAYLFDGSFSPLKSFRFVSHTLTGLAPGVPGNRFADSWMGLLPVPLPRQYVIGIDIQKGDFERDRPSYMAGVWHSRGFAGYYGYAALVKVPHGTQLLITFAAVLFVVSPLIRSRQRLGLWLPLLLVPALLLLLVSREHSFSHNWRYAIPALGFLFVLAGAVTQLPVRRIPVSQGFVVASVACLIASSIAASPRWISYFNELSGGSAQSVRHLAHSSLEWGQDLHLVRRWQVIHGDKPVALIEETPRIDLYSAMGIKVDPEASTRIISANVLLSQQSADELLASKAERIGAGYWVFANDCVQSGSASSWINSKDVLLNP